MLRGMVLQNFVHFKERFCLDFTKSRHGPNIFVGASSTGKTTVLELIRRCMDSKLSSSLTNRAKLNERAYVFCEFSVDFVNYGHTVITGMIVDVNPDTQLYTDGKLEAEAEDKETIKNENKPEELRGEQGEGQGSQNKKDKEVNLGEEGKMFHKVIMYTLGGKTELFSETYLERRDGKIVNLEKNVKLPQSFLVEVLGKPERGYSLLKEPIKHINDKFVGEVLREIGKHQNTQNTNDLQLYQELWGKIEEKFVSILPTRGLGTMQWTKSKLIESKYKEKNYEGICVHAEIITDLLDSGLIDKKREDEIFSFLTNSSEIVFRKEAPNANGIRLIQVKNGIREFPLLKTSVGIIEAKHFSLIMAHKTLKTICLEEPDRGMHPQMIERMKEVLHHESQQKTIIVVTHSPYLIDSMSLENTFFFSRKNDEALVVNIYDKLKTNKYFKIIKLEDMKAILFSSKVLFVEGTTDKIVLQAIFRNLQRSYNKSYRDILPILSHEICFMGGKELKDNASEFCDRLHINFCLVLDRNAYIETEESNKCIKKISQDFSSYNTFHGRCVSEFLANPDGFKAFSTDLEKHKKTFIWKDGDIEDYILSCREKRSEILKIFKPDATFTEVDNEENYKKMKTTIKDSLTKGLFRDTLDALAEIIAQFSETERLCSFLKDI